MTYESRWERLSKALERVKTAARVAEDKAKEDICKAIAERVVNIRGKLREDRNKLRTSNAVLVGGTFHIPHDLKPEDLDWDGSRPLKLWEVQAERFRISKLWYLDWIELSVDDVTRNLCQPARQGEAPQGALSNARAASRSRPPRERASQAIAELYPQGVPTQAALPNASLCRRVGRWVRERGLPVVSEDTILRAAGRRR
jgi:hypothetical protein